MMMSSYSAAGNHCLHCTVTLRWDASPAGNCSVAGVAATRFPGFVTLQSWSPPAMAAPALPATHQGPEVQMDSTGSSGDAEGSGVQSVAVTQPEGLFFFLRFYLVISYWIFWQLSIHSAVFT